MRAAQSSGERSIMETYVAEIDGQAIIAFRAEDDDEAYDIVNEENGGIQLGLNGFSGLLRADGKVLWDGESAIIARRATEDEHKQWLKGLDAGIGKATEGAPIDLSVDDPDDCNVYLIPVIPVDDDEYDDGDEEEEENT
jgi:hypothetical protein